MFVTRKKYNEVLELYKHLAEENFILKELLRAPKPAVKKATTPKTKKESK